MILKDVGKRDMVVVALAGHGIRFDKDKDSYFCPQDARPYEDEVDSLVSLTAVFDKLDRSGAGVKFLLVDACRNDPKASRRGGRRRELGPKRLRSVRSPCTVARMASGPTRATSTSTASSSTTS